MGSDWALPGENINFQSATGFRQLGPLHHARHAVDDDAVSLQRRVQDLQAPGYVVFNLEMIHEARVIPTDGRKPLDPAIKQYMGESRGHWEGTTLVVETTNFQRSGHRR